MIPEALPEISYTTLALKHNIEHNITDVLKQIDPSRLIKGNHSQKNNSYKLEELKQFARKIGINVNQSKDSLIDAISEKLKNN